MTNPQPVSLQQHPLSAAWPKMKEADFAALVEDIRLHGQMDPGVIFEGQVLDGWHRYRACEIVGVEYRSSEFDGEDPRAFVISKNRHRRHESAAVLAVCAAACTAWRPNGGDQTAPVQSGTTIKDAATAAGVSERTMAQAKAAVQVGLGEEVKDGKVSLKDAERVAKMPKAKRDKAVKQIKDGEAPLAPKKPKVVAASPEVEKLYEACKAELVEAKEALAEMADIAASAKAFEEKTEFKEMQVLRAELRSCKRRRDELMAENASMKKHIAHLQKKLGKK